MTMRIIMVSMMVIVIKIMTMVMLMMMIAVMLIVKIIVEIIIVVILAVMMILMAMTEVMITKIRFTLVKTTKIIIVYEFKRRFYYNKSNDYGMMTLAAIKGHSFNF